MMEPGNGVTRGARLFVAIVLAAMIYAPARAEEGMWTFDNPPSKQLPEKYGFTPSQQWLDHLQLASVRFNDGGSGSFISPNGLVLTNHHVARGQLEKISTAAKDYVHDGFLALDAAHELKCPDLELNVLVSMSDVTARVHDAAKSAPTEAAAHAARKAEMERIAKESLDATGLRSDVVTLYSGGEYWLYRYKRYTDIRLVFAPEQQIAYFGGDPDNFTFPRHDLDMAIFRVYENGRPAHSPSYLRWNPNGAKAGELVFVSGHPGSTDRQTTVAALELLRDRVYPYRLASAERRVALLRQYSARGAEQARQAATAIFGMENSLKVWRGELKGLQDTDLMARLAEHEKAFRALVAANADWQKAFGGAWDAMATAHRAYVERLGAEEILRDYRRRRSLLGSRLLGTTMQLVQYVVEIGKPDGARLDDFQESKLESLRFRMFSPAPVYLDLEETELADGLSQAAEELGADNPLVRAALAGKSPAEAAHAALAGTRMSDPAYRRELAAGGPPAVASARDPLVAFARRIDPLVREMQAWHEANVESLEAAAGELIGKARFAVYGKAVSPDATFTLRLSYGTVAGYPMNGTVAPPKTTFYGLFDRSFSFDGKPPFDLPARFIERRDRLDLATPLDFVCTCDIIGGNSGSPVVNRTGEIVGLIFDGNVESLVGRFVYDETANRAVAVHTAAMTAALKTLYDATPLLDEILGR